jgi:hypothetical protein
MHFVKAVTYVSEYKLLLSFEDDSIRLVDLADELDGEIFEPLKDIDYFRTVRVNQDVDTISWENGADMSPDFLYEIGTPVTVSDVQSPLYGPALTLHLREKPLEYHCKDCENEPTG